MPIPLPTYTVEMVRAFPDDGQRYELVEGMLLVTPAPAPDHQIVIARVMFALKSYLGEPGPAHVVSPGEIEVAYLRVGVAEVWMVDLDRRCVEVSGTDGRRAVPEERSVRSQPAGMARGRGMDVKVESLFRDL